MDSNAPPHHGGPLGDVWFRGLPKPDHFLTALKEDFYIMVVGCMMKYIRLERDEGGLNYRARIVRAFNHGVDGIAAICGNQYRDVYAMAEKRLRPRIFLFQIYKSDRGELEPNYMHSLKRIHSWDIRSMSFISKELLVVLTGIPTFNVVLFRWSTNEELMTSRPSDPSLSSRLLISPMNPLNWVEYGEEYMFVYEMPSLSRTDVIRTKINLPKRTIRYEHADPLMGKQFAIKIVSACWTNTDEFYILDEHYGIHKYIPELKILQWACSLTKTFLGCTVNQIVPFSDGLAAISKEGWFINYGPIRAGGLLEALSAYKLSSNVVRYIHFPETPESFFAITESKGVVEGVTHGLLRDAFSIPDLMYSDIKSCCFIEPHADYMAIVTKFGKVVVLESSSGEPIAKWKLPFKIVGIACHPILPFMFCGTTYGCINVLDIRNLKTPKLINRRFFTREPNCSIERFGFVSQGRYVISADVTNSRIFVQYGYPFMAFDFIDSAKVPARICHISTPGCGKDDNRFQVYMSGKSESDEGVVAFIINFSLRNDRLMVVASQIVDQPVTAMCMTPMKKHLYAFYPTKKGLGVVPFCDDNQWLNLQEPEHYVECRFKHDVSFMTMQGNRLYTFGEDGCIQVHEAPIIPKKKNQLPMKLQTIAVAQTHCFSDRGIKEGIVSFDGSQIIALGQDGTFARVRFFAKPKEPDWQTLGYERSKLIDYQVGTYLIDQEFYKSGEEFVDRIADIKIKIDQVDPVNFYGPGEESDEDEDASPNSEMPKMETNGEKFKYGPRRSFKGTITRKKLQRSDKNAEGGKDTSTTSSSSKKHVKINEIMEKQAAAAANEIKPSEGPISGGETTRADDISLGHTTQESDSKPADPEKVQQKSETSIASAEAPKTEDTTNVTAEEEHKSDGGQSPTTEKSDKASVSPNPDEANNAAGSQKSSEKSSGEAETKKVEAETVEKKDEHSSDSQKSSETPEEFHTDKEPRTEEDVSAAEAIPVDPLPAGEGGQEQLLPDLIDSNPMEVVTESDTQVVMEPLPDTTSAPDVEVLLAPHHPLPDSSTQKQSIAPEPEPEPEKPTPVISTMQRLLSKVHDDIKPAEEPPKPAQAASPPPLPQKPSTAKPIVAPASAVKTATAAPTSSALKGILSERTRRKQMAKDKNVKPEKVEKKVVEAVPEADLAELPVEVIEEVEAELQEEATGPTEEVATKGKKGAGFKGVGEMKKAAKVLGLLFGKKKEKKGMDMKKRGSKKKIKKFQGGQASKALAAAQASATTKLKAPPPSRTARNRMGQAKMVKQLMDDADVLDPLSKLKKKKGYDPNKGKGRVVIQDHAKPGADHYKRGRKVVRREEDLSEASKALLMEGEAAKNLEISVLQDPAIYLMPEKEAKPYEGLDVEDVLTVEHKIRRKEFTESEFFSQFEKTLLYRQHVPKAHSLRNEFSNFTEMMDDLMMFNKQREEGNQVEMKEFNFDEDREPRLQERSQKAKKIAHIQMTVRNKLRHARINAMKLLVWEQFDMKGMTIMGFRKKLEVSNYPLLPEKEYHQGPVTESISWRRIERRLNLEEIAALREANLHALRVLQHEMQFVPAVRKRLYMKSIMNIDPSVRFDEYEASDSEQSDEEFFAKVFEELGIQIPDDVTSRSTFARPVASLVPEKDLTRRSKAAKSGIALEGTLSKSNKKHLKNTEEAKTAAEDFKKLLQQKDSSGEAYGDKLKKWLLQEETDEEIERPIAEESSDFPTEETSRAQSRREFMANIKPSKDYVHPKGVFGPTKGHNAGTGGSEGKEVETLLEPHAPSTDKGRRKSDAGASDEMKSKDFPPLESKPKLRMVVKQRKKMKFKRTYDVIFDEAEDQSGPEDEAVLNQEKEKFEGMDDEYKERFQTVNNIFYGSSVSELTDMYQYTPAPYRYTQFELASRHELWRHQHIIMSEIYYLKKFFNRQFEFLRNSKGYSLRKMSDRNERIREIYYYLKVDLDILDEKWKLQEDPSQIFTVTKEEVPVERYLTVEQRRLEELRRLEDLARRRTRMAEFRKKALHVMMDNRLEVKREEILINDIPKPPFMLEKDPLEFSLEEYLASLQYAEAVEALDKARIELIKELEDELGRLYRANAMDINTIDLRVVELSLMKFQFHQNILMEETRIYRAIRQLRMMEELDKEEKRVGRLVQDLKTSMKGSQNMASHMENKKIECEEQIAKFTEQEKDLERSFRKDLGDVGQYFEFFYKTYKKKPKLSMKGLNKSEVYENMTRALRSDNIRAFARENGEMGRLVVMAIYDMEDPMLMPKDCPRSYWDKFNKIRRDRLVCEYETKALMNEIDRLNEAISECSRKEAAGTAAIAAVLGVVSHKNDLKTYFVANVEFQMVLGKGQCEIDCWNFKEHTNANIILIDNVEKLNQNIYVASDKLVKEMTKTAVVHRDIKEIEWRFMVVEMATQDLKKIKHDVMSFKPTKKLLEVLRKNINLDTMYADRIALVDYLRSTYIKYQKIFLRSKRGLLRFYQRLTSKKHELNEGYRGNIFEQTEALVASQVTKIPPELVLHQDDVEKRAAELKLRSNLNRKMLKLCSEVERLEGELETQYQRTYPVL